MRVVVTAEVRLARTPDGRVWTTMGLGYPFWQRYLSAYDRVRVVARVLDVDAVPASAAPVEGPAVEVWPVPYYLGPGQYLRRSARIRRGLAACAGPEDMVIVRAPSPIGALLAAHRRRHGRPYAVELVGDPADVFARGVLRHPLRPLLRRWSVTGLGRLCRFAGGVAYVTERALQERYPAAPSALTATFSSIELDEASLRSESFMDGGRALAFAEPYRLVSVGSLEQRYKGIDVLIEAVARLGQAGLAVRWEHVGDGRHRPELEAQVARLGIAGAVTFAGALPPGPAVRRRLDGADLFVLPSRAEGLPRALIEAMARGLPAIGSTVGGIPELLPAEFLVPPDDPAALAAAIAHLLADSARMATAGETNRRRAEDFASSRLSPRRAGWYTALRDAYFPHAGLDGARLDGAGLDGAGLDGAGLDGAGFLELRAPRVRVVHVIGTLDRGGAETVALDVCRAIPASEVHQTFVTLGGREGSLADEFRVSGAAVTQCPLAPVPTFPHRLWRQLRALRPDVVVSHVSLASGLVLLIALLAGVRRRVARLHSEGDGREPRPLRQAALRACVRLCATDVVGVTRAALRFATPREGDARYRVLPNGVNVTRLRGPGRSTARAKVGVPANATIFVHIGRSSPEKNRPFLLEIHRAVRRLLPDALLVVVGPGGPADLVGADAAVLDDDSVLLLGERRDVGTVLAAADVLLLPSVREGLPGVVLEALACGVPVLATDLPGLREVDGCVPGLTLLPLAAGATRWAQSAVELAGLAEPGREGIRQAMRTSPFEFDTTLRGWEQLCQPRR